MTEEQRKPLRADAERNRRRLIEAATTMFCERGLEVGVGEIAESAGVGRGTLFRNFPSKEDLIVAIVVERMEQVVQRGRAALDQPDAGAALFALIDEAVRQSLTDKALFDALDDTWLGNPEIHAAHAEVMSMLEAVLSRAQAAGAVRDDVGAVDLLMMLKGTCEAIRSFPHLEASLADRQLDLIRAALSSGPSRPPLRGERPTLQSLEPRTATPAPD